MPPVYTDWDFLQRVCQQVGFHRLLFAKLMNRKRYSPWSDGYWYHIDSGQLRADELARCIFRPLKERIPADLYIVYETHR